MRKLFDSLYVDFLARRNRYVKNARFKPWFKYGDDSAFPPVIGFGLPRREDEQVPFVTIATNPSTIEFTGHIRRDDESVETQWMEQTGYFERRDGRGPYRQWFDFSNDLVTEVRQPHNEWWSHYQFSHEGGDLVADGSRTNSRVPHLDLTPITTDGGMDTIDRGVADKGAGPELLGEGIEFCLLPLLEHLVQHHGTRAAILYGHLPEDEGQELLKRTLRNLFSESGQRVPISRKEPSPGITVVQGAFNVRHPWVAKRQALKGLRVAFCSHSPSYLNHPKRHLARRGSPPSKYSDSMTDAGLQIRTWFKDLW